MRRKKRRGVPKKPSATKKTPWTYYIKTSLKYFFLHPITLIPMLICWVFYSAAILYAKYVFDWDSLDITSTFIWVYFFIFIYSVVISSSCLLLLEIVKQLETTGRANIFKAIFNFVIFDLIRALPIIIIWSAIWFVLAIVRTILSRNNENDDDSDLSLQSATLTLAGMDNGGFSSLTGFIEMLKTSVRMVVFIILTAVAWERGNPINEIKRGLTAFRMLTKEFLKAFATNEIFAAIIFLPVAILVSPLKIKGFVYPDIVLIFILICIGLSWSICFLCEQLSMAQLYLWYIVFEKENKEREQNGKPRYTNIYSVRIPTFFDGIENLKNIN